MNKQKDAKKSPFDIPRKLRSHVIHSPKARQSANAELPTYSASSVFCLHRSINSTTYLLFISLTQLLQFTSSTPLHIQNASSTPWCRPYSRPQWPYSPNRCPCSACSPAAAATLDCRPPAAAPGSSHAGSSSAELWPRPLRPDGFDRRVSLPRRGSMDINPAIHFFSSRENPGSQLSRHFETTANIFVSSGVAVGSSIGHAIGGMFSGGGSSAPAEAQQQAPAQSQPMDNGLWQSSATNQAWENPACETDVRNFRRCMDENQGNMSICGWYLDQLVRIHLVCRFGVGCLLLTAFQKACQAAAKPY